MERPRITEIGWRIGGKPRNHWFHSIGRSSSRKCSSGRIRGSIRLLEIRRSWAEQLFRRDLGSPIGTGSTGLFPRRGIVAILWRISSVVPSSSFGKEGPSGLLLAIRLLKVILVWVAFDGSAAT